MAWTRRVTCSFRNTLFKWHLTVFSLMQRAFAISLFVPPDERDRRISVSLFVSAGPAPRWSGPVTSARAPLSTPVRAVLSSWRSVAITIRIGTCGFTLPFPLYQSPFNIVLSPGRSVPITIRIGPCGFPLPFPLYQSPFNVGLWPPKIKTPRGGTFSSLRRHGLGRGARPGSPSALVPLQATLLTKASPLVKYFLRARRKFLPRPRLSRRSP